MNLLLFKCRFFGLIKAISPKICIVRVRVKSYKRSFEPFCVWIWLDKCLHILWPETDWSFLYRNCFTELRPVPDSSDKGSEDWRRCWKLSENNCWPSAVWLLTICRLTRRITVDHLPFDCWPSAVRLLTICRSTVDHLPFDCWPSAVWQGAVWRRIKRCLWKWHTIWIPVTTLQSQHCLYLSQWYAFVASLCSMFACPWCPS